jgi:hypothetical protein
VTTRRKEPVRGPVRRSARATLGDGSSTGCTNTGPDPVRTYAYDGASVTRPPDGVKDRTVVRGAVGTRFAASAARGALINS